MPPLHIDYSNAIFYKILCKNREIKDAHVGYTTNFRTRKYQHKRNSMNQNSKTYNLPIYVSIRNHGGWANWDIIEIGKRICVDMDDANAKVKSFLSRIAAYGDVYCCPHCDQDFNAEGDLETHMNIHPNQQVEDDNTEFECGCGRSYKHRTSLHKHKKSCGLNTITTAARITPEMVLEMVQHNQELQQLMMEQTHQLMTASLEENRNIRNTLVEHTQQFQNTLVEQNQQFQNTLVEQVQTTQTQLVELAKNQQTINNSLVQNNCDNRTQFSINIFLNQDCKDAIDINQFVDSISVSVSDFIATGEMGHVSGISRIITNKLRELDVYQRPIHCTDAKRETIYIKNKDGWERETDDKPHFREVVHKVTNKNLKQLPAWQRQNPRFSQINTEENEKFIQYSLAALGNESNEENKDVDRIMHTVSKDIVIDKKIQQFAVK